MNELIFNLIAKKLSGEANPDDERMLNEWLENSPGNRVLYEEYIQLWERSGVYLTAPVFDTDAAWQKVSPLTVYNRSSRKKISLIVLSKYVGAIAAILLIGVMIYILVPPTSSLTEVVATNGKTEILLPDNSHVSLRQGSKLYYPRKFTNNQRRISVEGEAYFEVTRIESSPFIIDAQSVTVQVLGTSFNVICDRFSANITVIEGKVLTTAKTDSAKKIIVTGGKKAVYKNTLLTEEYNQNNNFLYWKTGVLTFENEKLTNIIKQLSLFSETKISIDPSIPITLQNQLVTIIFNSQAIEDNLTDICLVVNCSWVKENGQYVISAK